MKILFAMGDSPWPARSGGDLRVQAIHTVLGELGSVTPVLFTFRAVDRSACPPNAIIHPIPPPSGVARAANRVRAIAARRHHFVEQLVRAGAIQSLRADIGGIRPDVVLLTFPLFGPIPTAVRGVSPTLIVDIDQLRAPVSLRSFRTASGWRPRLRAGIDLFTAAATESGAIAAADSVWVASAKEADAIVRQRPRRVHTIANAIEVGAYQSYWATAPTPSGFAYVGAFDYEPNETAASWLMERVLPVVRLSHPEARLVLIGRSPTDRLRRRSRELGVDLRADVPDAILELAEVGILAVGLQSGGGTRLKILEAWAAGVPVVSTSVGIEGLVHEDGRDVLVANAAEGMAAAIVRVMDGPEVRSSLIRGGLERVRDRYGLEALAAEVRAAVEEVAG